MLTNEGTTGTRQSKTVSKELEHPYKRTESTTRSEATELSI